MEHHERMINLAFGAAGDCDSVSRESLPNHQLQLNSRCKLITPPPYNRQSLNFTELRLELPELTAAIFQPIYPQPCFELLQGFNTPT